MKRTMTQPLRELVRFEISQLVRKMQRESLALLGLAGHDAGIEKAHTGRRIALERVDRAGEKIGLDRIVGRTEVNIFALRALEAGVLRREHTAIGIAADDGHARIGA